MKWWGIAVVLAGLLAAAFSGCGGSDETTTTVNGQAVVRELTVIAQCDVDSDSYFAAEKALLRLERVAEKDPDAEIRASKKTKGELGGLERGLQYPLTAPPVGGVGLTGPATAGTISDVLTATARTYRPCLEGSALDGLHAVLRKIRD